MSHYVNQANATANQSGITFVSNPPGTVGRSSAVPVVPSRTRLAQHHMAGGRHIDM